MARGDHLYVSRGLYTHHGIDVGDGTVIHFAGKPGGAGRDAAIVRSTLADFLQGGTLRVRRHPHADAPDLVVARALSRLGERGYGLLRNNCEHFATWCCTGHGSSHQVRQDTVSALTVAIGGLLLSTVVVRRGGAPGTRAGRAG